MKSYQCPNCNATLHGDIYRCPHCGADINMVSDPNRLRRNSYVQGGAMAAVASAVTCLVLGRSVTLALIGAGVGFIFGIIFTALSFTLTQISASRRKGTAEQSAWFGLLLVICSGISAGIAVATLIKIP